MKRENDLESGLISKSRVNKEEHNKEQEEEDNENKKVFEIISSSPKLQVRKYDYFVASVHDNIKSIS